MHLIASLYLEENDFDGISVLHGKTFINEYYSTHNGEYLQLGIFLDRGPTTDILAQPRQLRRSAVMRCEPVESPISCSMLSRSKHAIDSKYDKMHQELRFGEKFHYTNTCRIKLKPVSAPWYLSIRSELVSTSRKCRTILFGSYDDQNAPRLVQCYAQHITMIVNNCD